MDYFRDPNIQKQYDQSQSLLGMMGERQQQNLNTGNMALQGQAMAPQPQQSPLAPSQPNIPSSGMGSELSPNQSSLVAPSPAPYNQSSALSVLGDQGTPPAPTVQDQSALAPTGNPSQSPIDTSLSLPGGVTPQLSEQEAMMKISSQDEKDQGEVLMDDRYHSFITPNNPVTAPIFQQTDSYKLMDGTDGGNLPISEDNGSVYQCPFTQTPCSRPSFFKRIGAFIKKLFGIYDDNQALAVCQTENLRDPIARQVLQSTGEFDKEVNEQLAEAQQPTTVKMPEFQPHESQDLKFGRSNTRSNQYDPQKKLR